VSLVHQKKPCDGEDEESHGDDVGQAKQNEEGPGNEKGGDSSGLNEEGVNDGMQMDFGNEEPCVSPAQFDGGDNPPMDDDEPFNGDVEMLSPQRQDALPVCHSHPYYFLSYSALHI